MDSFKNRAQRIFGSLPMLAELDVNIRLSQYPRTRYLERLEDILPTWIEDYYLTEEVPLTETPKNIFVFSGTQKWNPHTILLSLLYSKLGHDVHFGFVPYRKWYTAQTKYNTRKMNHFLKILLAPIEPIIDVVPMLDIKSNTEIPDDMVHQIRLLSTRDCQYTYQVEKIDETDALFRLRQERNSQVTKVFLAYCETNKPDIVILPNGMVFEFGAIFQCCKYLNIPVTTYEFGEQQERIWLDQNNSVMLQNTSDMWEQVKDTPFEQHQLDTLDNLYKKRKGGNTHKNFARKWQTLPQQGGEKVKSELGLDNRPIMLMATNVIGDSLTLGREIFSNSMTHWILNTIDYIIPKSDVQLVVRIHPGEKIMTGPSVSEAIKEKFSKLPEHIHIIEAEDSINTYDLINIADLGLTYTTTVGLEITMSNIPVIVVGNTHYRGRGFTYDPNSWDEYYKLLDEFIGDIASLPSLDHQVELSQKYAFHFFFTYPHIFPWHLGKLEENYQQMNLKNIFLKENWNKYHQSFEYLLGKQILWNRN